MREREISEWNRIQALKHIKLNLIKSNQVNLCNLKDQILA